MGGLLAAGQPDYAAGWAGPEASQTRKTRLRLAYFETSLRLRRRLGLGPDASRAWPAWAELLGQPD